MTKRLTAKLMDSCAGINLVVVFIQLALGNTAAACAAAFMMLFCSVVAEAYRD